MPQIINPPARVLIPEGNARQTPTGAANQNPSESQINGSQVNRTPKTNLGIGDRSPQVQEAQQLLDEAGHSPGPLDGIFGSQTQGAAQAFQQERIDSLEATLEGGPPPAARSEITSQLQHLRDEQARNVAGEETQAQLAQRVPPPTEENDGVGENDGAGETNETTESPEATADELDVPDTEEVQSTLDSILAGDIDEALENGLNSEGDSVSISLNASAKAPAGIVGVEGEIGADITRVADGYEVSLSAEAAVSLGLVADSNDLGVGADIGAGATVIYHYDTLDQAKQGVGGELVYTTTANALGDQLGSAGQSFLNGDFNDSFEAIGDIEGELQITGRSVSGASFSAGADALGAELAVGGSIRFEDLGETQTTDLTLEEAFDFLTDQVEDAYDDFQPRIA